MSDFDDLLVSTRSIFLDHSGDTVNYYPRAGGVRQITAVISRGRPEETAGPHGTAPLATIWVANDDTDGIASDEIDLGGDEIEFAVRMGTTPVRKRITKILQEDAGFLELQVR